MNTARIAGTPVARIAGAAALVVAAALATSACSLVAPQATLIHYDPADGVSADLGPVKVRDAQALMGESGEINLYFYAINSGDLAAQLHVAAGEAGGDATETLDLAAGAASTVGGPDDAHAVLIEAPSDVELGGLYPVYFQAGDAAGQQILVPVLNAEHRPYFEEYMP